MSKRVIPYIAHGIEQRRGPALPMDSPTTATRRVYGENPAMSKLITLAGIGVMVPIAKPYAGQGAMFPAFPKVMPSSVAPNARGVTFVAAMNDFSPSTHRDPATVEVPAVPLGPTGTGISPKRGLSKAAKINVAKRGTGGGYTIPAPLNQPRWPTSSQWLAKRMSGAF